MSEATTDRGGAARTTDPRPTAPGAATDADGPPHPASAPAHGSAPSVRTPRAAALEAGRWFYRARALACELALSGRSATPDRLLREVVPELVGVAVGLGPPADEAVERVLVPGLRELVEELSGVEWVEWLRAEQQALDTLSGSAREEYDLDGHRARLLRDVHDGLDAVREAFLVRIAERIAAAFRLGERIEAGALPLTPDHTGSEPPAPPAPSPRAGFGATAGPERERDRRLSLALLAAARYDRPWPPWWPGKVRAAWAACGLPPDGLTIPDDSPQPPGPDARAEIVDSLVTLASGYFEALDRPSVTLTDRFRIVDAGAMTVCLDGRVIAVQSRPAFLILRELLRAPEFQMRAKEINALPGCKGDVSKIVATLPADFGGVQIVHSRPGPGSFYYLHLPSHEPGGD